MAAASVSNSVGSLNGRMHNPGSGIAFEIEMSECVVGTTPPIPKRVRQRLEETLESKFKSPASLEEIEAKLKEADSRRQQFHEWLANKARPRPRLSPSHSEQAESLAQRLEAKLSAAEHKRAELLAHEQTRLAKSHELRVAAKTEAQLRAEREREELGSKVEFRVQQAETNRLALVEAERQRIAAVHERVAHSILQRSTKEERDRDRIEALRATICQKIAAAEEKRAGLLEAEKNRAQACVLQARRVAKAVVRERELEMRSKREKLEARLQRAKRQRAEYLMKRGGCRGSCHNHGQKLHKHGDRLCRKLTRCWRQFRGSRRTTYALAQEYAACGINQELVISLPFEELASRITSSATLRGVKPLLARIECRVMLSCAGKSNLGHVEHLLKRLSPPRRKTGGLSSNSTGKNPSLGPNKSFVKDSGRSQIVPKTSKENGKSDERELERYPARVFLCAYMILGQPDAVFSGRGERESALAEAAARLLPEFEALISFILNGPSSTAIRPYSLDDTSDKGSAWVSEKQENQNNFRLPSLQGPFSARLAAFDNAWCAYLYQFVAWKVKDAQSLEEDLTRMACQLEISMLQKCRVGANLSHDTQAIREQVLEDQKLLHDRILRLTGTAGASRMEQALAEVRSKFNEAVENGTPLPSPFSSPPVSSRTPVPSSTALSPPLTSAAGVFGRDNSSIDNRSKVVRALFNSPTENYVYTERASVNRREPNAHPVVMPTSSEGTGSTYSNEKLVSEMLYDQNWQLPNASQLNSSLEHHGAGAHSAISGRMNQMQAQIRSTMEKAFWDGIMEGLLQTKPVYERVVILVAEIRDDLQSIVPENWKQDLLENMDLDLVSQILESGSNDFNYLRHLLDYASGLIIKLGAPVRDSETKAAHQSLLTDLLGATVANVKTQSTFANALVKGLRFVFNQLQVLKQDISSTRIRALAPLISGSAGIDYLRKAFALHFNISTVPPFSVVELASILPRTAAWIGKVIPSLERERADFETSLATLRGTSVLSHGDSMAARLPAIPSMRTGGRICIGGLSTNAGSALQQSVGVEAGPRALVWESNDTILRMGILQLIQKFEAASEATLPETLSLSVERVRTCQDEFQRVVVMATGLLVARQALSGKGVRGTQLDRLVETGSQQLDALLSEPSVTTAQIGALLAHISSKTDTSEARQEDVAAQCEFMTRVLSKSLSQDDPVFARILVAVTASFRAVLLLGKGPDGLALAEIALKRIGGSMLLDKVTSTADMLDKISHVTSKVHEPWYSCLISSVP